jgi:hypothetical protein
MVALLALSLAPIANAAPKAKVDGRSPQQKGATDERLKTRALWKLAWHADWKAAVLANRFERRKARPIVHLRILGDLAAKT